MNPDGADIETVVEVIQRCPTGALTFERSDGGSAETAAAKSTVVLAADGPAYLRGDLRIENANGDTLTETRAALCRCGATTNAPFCDGSHSKAEFADSAQAGEAKTKDAPEGQTFLKARVLPDGPVLLEGPYELIDGDGSTCLEAGSGYLCRCGGSTNRPWCDGTHGKIGFKEDATFKA